MPIYFDNDVASTVSRRDRDASDLAAVDKLLELGRSHAISIATSRQSTREMERAPAAHQRQLKSGLGEMAITPDDHRVLGSHTLTDLYGGCICNPLVTDIVDEGLYSKLRGAGLKDDDAKHLMYASHNHCDRFLTWDRNFLSRRSTLRALCPSLQIQAPNEFVREMEETQVTKKP